MDMDKIESAEKRVQSRDRNFTQEVRDLISMTSGQFRIGQLFRESPNIGAKDRAKIRVVLRRLVRRQHHRARRQGGWYISAD